MRVLLDVNLDCRLRTSLGERQAFPTSRLGWSGWKNGKLLDVAEANGFNVLLTGERTLYFEQDLTARRLAILEWSSVEWRILKDRLPEIVAAIDAAKPGLFQRVECGKFTRKRQPHEEVR